MAEEVGQPDSEVIAGGDKIRLGSVVRISRRALGKLLTAVRGEQADGSAKVAA